LNHLFYHGRSHVGGRLKGRPADFNSIPTKITGSAKASAERSTLPITVECYAGYRGEQTPRVLVLDDRRVAVVEVLDQWLAPDHRYFKVRTEDDSKYIVRQDVASGEWTITMFQRAGT
jgi:hypothetical protein